MTTSYPQRPYARDDITELERLYNTGQIDDALADALAAELDHRTTDRAGRLAVKIKSGQQKRHENRNGEQGSLQTGGVPTAHPPPGVQSVAAIPLKEPTAPSAHSIEDIETKTALQKLEAPFIAGGSALKDAPSSILSAWISFEVLAPLTYKDPAKLADDDRSRVVKIGNGQLPWEQGQKAKPNYKLFYLVLLGEVNVDTVTADLLRVFGDNEETPKRQGMRAPIAMAIVDKQGVLVGLETVAISSFAWGAPVVLREKIGSLARWPDAEKILSEQLLRRLTRVDDAGNALPLNLDTINECHVWLQKTLGLRNDHVYPPSFVVRMYHFFKLPGAPESPLINSFYIADLAKARGVVNSNTAPQTLKRYLAIVKPSAAGDLLKNKASIAELVAPSRFPLARWPSPGGHPLVTLQQAAVNAIRTEFLNDQEGIIAVNGPPGTGKTTLLRELVAHCVTSRAVKLAAFDDPNQAFLQTGEQIKVGDGAFLRLYGLDATIKGFEVLVASSNNKAVENVSKELPAGKSIEPGPKYFASIAKVVCADEQNPPTEPADDPWGLIAAVLGNRRNIGKFQQTFWWHKEYGFSIYLKAARGLDVSRDEASGEGGSPKKVNPAIVAAERPLNGDAALQQWKKARKSFSELKHLVEAKLSKLEAARELPAKLATAKAAVENLCSEQVANLKGLELARTVHAIAAEDAAKAKITLAKFERELNAIGAARPWFFARLFRTLAFRQWVYEASIKKSAYQDADRVCRHAGEEFAAAIRNQQKCTNTLALTEDALGKAELLFENLYGQLKNALATIGDRFADGRYFEREHAVWNSASPWLDDEIHREREALFIQALEVHKAFITVAAQKVQHNLGVLMTAMQSGAFKDPNKRKLLGDLWSTLFLVIPVVSTTFASVDRMLGDLSTGSIGWLLVDEAGQATPQAAIGALMRARRAVVVGDPLQIPPVVTIPEKLINQISKHFGVSCETWCAPEASVQTLADGATHIKAKFSTSSGEREVGLPLLVHRRCQDPMFSVSNSIAYDGKMVYAAGADKVGNVGLTLGASAWFDIGGDANSKWSPAEGQAVMRLLRQLARAGIQNPDVYVISPFRVVAHEMRQLLRAEPELFKAFGVEERKWLNERVGTIHTFQGKEAEAVIAVLGAPMSSQIGARHWASSTPNILNVMVSRAKSRLYVVGSHAAWSGVGHFAELSHKVPVRLF